MAALIRRTLPLAIAALVAVAVPSSSHAAESVKQFKVSGTTFEQWFEPALSGELDGYRFACAARDPKLSYRVAGLQGTGSPMPLTNYLFSAQDWKTEKFTIGQYLPALAASTPSITLSEVIRDSLAGNGPMPRNDGIGLLGEQSGYWVLVNYNRPLPVGAYGALIERAGLFTYRGITKPAGTCQEAGLPTYLVNAQLATM